MPMDGSDETPGTAPSFEDRLWAGIFGVVGLGVSALMLSSGVSSARDWLVFDEFVAVRGTVFASESGERNTGTRSHHGMAVRDGRWIASVGFRYEWEGRTLESWANVPSEDSEEAARAAAAAMATGTTLDVYVDPSDPAHLYVAAERPALAGAIATLVVGGFGVSLCLYLLIAAVVRRFGPARATGGPGGRGRD